MISIPMQLNGDQHIYMAILMEFNILTITNQQGVIMMTGHMTIHSF